LFQRILPTLLLLGCLVGCAPTRTSLKPPAFQAFPVPTPPALTDEQLMGLQKLRGLWKDEESGQFALKEVMEAYRDLREAALKDGWRLQLVSGYRSFGNQRRIWNKNDRRLADREDLTEGAKVRIIMSTVSIPGLSRHHWGTELDITERSLRGQLVPLKEGTPKKVRDFYDWMERNAPRYGFCRVYQGKGGSIVDEPWHWSYHPFASIYQEQFVKIGDFKGILNKDVAGIRYIIRNFGEIFTLAVRSVDSGCSPAKSGK